MKQISLKINGKPVSGAAEPRMHLADFLRDAQNLTGTHLGCEHGVCGACTLLVDGVPVRSCITFAVTCDGAEVVTIEGLDEDEIARELRAAFTREHALQCGYCTPGMLVSARDLVLRSPEPDEQAIRVAMSGNLCRCTGYVGIIRAIKSVIAARRGRGIAPVSGAGRTALGPAGSGHAAADSGAPAPVRRTPAVAAETSARSSARKPIDTDWTPQVSFDQSFQVAYPRQQVWDMFGRVEEVASCLPGAKILGHPSPDFVEGQIGVKVGPILAEFRGEAAIERDDSSYSGRIVGSGSDVRSNSSTRGMISYRLRPADSGAATRVEVTIGYTLTGMLAQVGRSGIVQDVAARLIAAFVRNLERRLSGQSGGEVAAADAGIDVGSLVFSVIWARVKALFAKLAGRA
jgi:aerobic carbon-monoxide dehydrogenase small subunit